MKKPIVFREMLESMMSAMEVSKFELANALGEPIDFITDLLSDDNYPNLYDVEKICEYFNAPMHMMLFGDDPITTASLTADLMTRMNQQRQNEVLQFATKKFDEQEKEDETKPKTNIVFDFKDIYR